MKNNFFNFLILIMWFGNFCMGHPEENEYASYSTNDLIIKQLQNLDYYKKVKKLLRKNKKIIPTTTAQYWDQRAGRKILKKKRDKTHTSIALIHTILEQRTLEQL